MGIRIDSQKIIIGKMITIRELALIFLAVPAIFACSSFKRKDSEMLECRLPGTRQLTNCHSDDLPQGTILKYRCSPNYIAVNAQVKSGEITCGRRNRWIGLDRFESFSCSIDCGRSVLETDEYQGLVVGGVPTGRYKWPWHASIFARTSPTAPYKYQCGGTLVKAHSKGFIIVTAAHCFADGRGRPRDPKIYGVLLGANYSNWEENNGLHGVQQHQVREIVIHDSYGGSSSDFQSDIALISLKDPVHLSGHVLPACFSGGDDLVEIGSNGSVVGFGAYEYTNPTVSKILRLIHIPVVRKDKCYEWRGRKLLPSEICAGYVDRLVNPSACNGDSGGGYVFAKSINNVERFYLEGIVSHGRQNIDNKKEECDAHSVFTKVSAYDPWIRARAEDMAANLDEEDNPSQEPKFIPTTPKPKLVTTAHRQPSLPESPKKPSDALAFPSRPPIVETTTRRVTQGGTAVRPKTPTVPATVPESPQVPVSPNDFKLTGLQRHNYYRRRHESPDLRLNEQLNKHAQGYAEKLLRLGELQNEYESGLNKNVYRQSGHSGLVPSAVVRAAVESWYAAVKTYNWDNPSYSTFSQVVWKSSTDVGFGYATRGKDHFVVAAYTPPGNVHGYFSQNVFPPQSGKTMEE